MTTRRGAALVLALLILLVAMAGSALALHWAVMQLRLGQAWRRHLDGEVALLATLAQVHTPSPDAPRVRQWFLQDSLTLLRVGTEGWGGEVEVLRALLPDTLPRPVPRGVLRLP